MKRAIHWRSRRTQANLSLRESWREVCFILVTKSAVLLVDGVVGREKGGGGGCWNGRGSEAEGPPGVVEAIRVGKADVAAGRPVLGVAGLHPHYVFRDAGLRGDREASHAAADAREGGGVNIDHAERGNDHGRDEGRGGHWVGMKRPGVTGPMNELREQRGAGRATAARARAGSAGGRGPGVGHVHEEPKLVVDVQLRVGGFAETHPVTLALLIVFAV